LIDPDSGVMLGGDGDPPGFDRQAAAAGYGELYRIERELITTLGTGDADRRRGDHAIAPLPRPARLGGQPQLLLCMGSIATRASGWHATRSPPPKAVARRLR